MPTNNSIHEPNGHRPQKHEARLESFAAVARQAKGALGKLDVQDSVRNYPYAAVAIAGGAGLVIGLTVGSRLIRMIVGSVGVFTVSELLRRYARRALDEMVDEYEVDVAPDASQPG
ncbi:MAG TPA: hypothetical protein VGH28_22595 [Polyangiaceae bacterium]|jgi:hypothetical protein